MANFLIIAGTSTIGHSITTLLKEQGHQVFITSRQQRKIDSLEDTTPSLLLEATDFAAVESVMHQAKQVMGSLDGVVNCAGSFLLKPAHLTSKEEYESVIHASLTSAFAVTKAAGTLMTEKGGSVVLISAAAALEGLPNHEAIAAAKAGIIGLTLSAAATYASYNLRFNAIAPGLVETPLTAELTRHPLSRKISEAMHALGRFGHPDEIARAVIFLLDPLNSWITGQVLAIDGGLSRVRPRVKTIS